MPAAIIWAPLLKTLFLGRRVFLGENGPLGSFHFAWNKNLISLSVLLLCIELALFLKHAAEQNYNKYSSGGQNMHLNRVIIDNFIDDFIERRN